MRIVDIRSLSGRNFYAHFPVVRLEIDLGSLRDTTTAALPHLTSRLMSWLPGLAEHHCGLGTAGGFLSRLQEGTYLGHVLEHVALELQSAAGWPVSFGKTRSLGEDGRYVVAYEYVVEQVGVEAGRMALQMLQAGVSGQDFAVAAGVQALQRTGARFQYGPSTMSIVQAARRRGIPVTRLDQRNLIQLGYGCHAMRLAATITGRTPCVAVDIAQDKMLTKTLLEEAG
ncbi:MAG TPA: cyanophycin synthetase, partial [Firmicutes bacterium]|nr:cyanophycin synthetase [Bacillota bacterium]